MFGIIDVIVLAVLVISILFALYRGLMRELLGISAWILAAFAALYSYDPLHKFLTGHVQNVKLATICGVVIIALIVMIIMTIFNAKMTHKLRKSSLSGLDRLLGFVFGIARAALIMALAYMLASSFILTKDQIKEMKANNRSVVWIQCMSKQLEHLLPDSIQKDLKSYEPEKTQESIKQINDIVEEYSESDREALDQLIENIPEIVEETEK
ncbi:MAG: CvpA family protein [Alphaproteobacteria bacterium]|nr:CvpA family protein [Alphaproteobacteria bacterium]